MEAERAWVAIATRGAGEVLEALESQVLYF